MLSLNTDVFSGETYVMSLFYIRAIINLMKERCKYEHSSFSFTLRYITLNIEQQEKLGDTSHLRYIFKFTADNSNTKKTQMNNNE